MKLKLDSGKHVLTADGKLAICLGGETVSCGNCTSGFAAEIYQLTMSSIANGFGDCSAANGTFTLSPATGIDCFWESPLFNLFGTNDAQYTMGIDTFVQVHLVIFGFIRVVWKLDPHDGECTSWNNLSIPYSHDFSDCDGSASSCLLTAL